MARPITGAPAPTEHDARCCTTDLGGTSNGAWEGSELEVPRGHLPRLMDQPWRFHLRRRGEDQSGLAYHLEADAVGTET